MDVTYLADHPKELGTIAKWYFDEWGEEGKLFSYQDIYEKVGAKLRNKTQLPFSLIVKDEDTVLGVIELKYRENKHHPEYVHWIGGVYVCPQNRNRRVASTLISSAKQHAESLGIDTLYLQCDAHNIPLYQKHGFKTLHKAEHYGYVTTIMLWETDNELNKG